MKLKVSDIRKIIREEVERMIRRSAGFGGVLGISSKNISNTEILPPGLGDEEKEEENGKEQQEK
jgi:hypothetical protein